MRCCGVALLMIRNFYVCLSVWMMICRHEALAEIPVIFLQASVKDTLLLYNDKINRNF